MSNRKYSKNKKVQSSEKRMESKHGINDFIMKRRKIFTAVGAVIIVALLIFVAYDLGAFKNNSSSNSSVNVTIPNPVPWGTFAQISTSNFSDNIHFYWISWDGCPIGAANSWGLYLAVQQHIPAISNDFILHKSFSGDSAPHEPGLLFTQNLSISNGKYYFTAFYMYNQTHTGTVGGTPIASNQLVSKGLQEVNATEPSFIASWIYQIQTQTPSQVTKGGSPIAPIGAIGHHLVTALIITGPKGAYYLNGPYFYLWDLTTNPSAAQSYINSPQYETYVYSPSYVYSNMKGIAPISDFAAEINTIVDDVS